MRFPLRTPRRMAVAATLGAVAAGAVVVIVAPHAAKPMALHAANIPMLQEAQAPAEAVQTSPSWDAPSGATAALVQVPPKLIRKARFRLEVKTLEEAARRLESMAAAEGGYLAQAEGRKEGGEGGSHHLSFRLPAGRFEAALTGIRREGRVLSESIGVEDVSRAYVDLEARLRNKRVAQARLRDILLTRTGKIADVVEAEQALTAVSEEIERMEAQRRHYDEETTYCSVDVDLVPTPIVAPPPKPSLWAPVGQSLTQSVAALRDSALTLLQLIATVLPWGALLMLAWAAFKGLRATRRTLPMETP